MASCAYCNATILFGGRRIGEHLYCNTHHALLGRSLDQAQTNDPKLLRELQEDSLALAEEVQQLRTSLNEAQERIDFLERAIAQLRAPGAKRD